MIINVILESSDDLNFNSHNYQIEVYLWSQNYLFQDISCFLEDKILNIDYSKMYNCLQRIAKFLLASATNSKIEIYKSFRQFVRKLNLTRIKPGQSALWKYGTWNSNNLERTLILYTVFGPLSPIKFYLIIGTFS